MASFFASLVQLSLLLAAASRRRAALDVGMTRRARAPRPECRSACCDAGLPRAASPRHGVAAHARTLDPRRRAARQPGRRRPPSSATTRCSTAGPAGAPVALPRQAAAGELHLHRLLPGLPDQHARAVGGASRRWTRVFGADQFNVVSIGFNQPVDSPQAMRAFAAQKRIDAPNWEFLSPPPAGVDALTRDFGFSYVATPAGFDHVLPVTRGRRRRAASTAGLRRPPVGATGSASRCAGCCATPRCRPTPRSSRLVERVRILCTVYDPETGTYRVDYGLLLEIAGGVTFALAMLWFFVGEWRAQRRLRRAPSALTRAAAPPTPLTSQARAHRTSASRCIPAADAPARACDWQLGGYRRLEHAFDARSAPRSTRCATSARSASCCSGCSRSAASTCTRCSTPRPPAPTARSTSCRAEQWYLGGVLRSLHRYAADAFVLVMAAAPAARVAARALQRLPPLLVADRRAAAAVRLRLRDRRLLAQLGPARPVLGASPPPSGSTALPLFAAPLTRNFLNVGGGQRPPVLAVRLRPPRRAAAAGVRAVVPHPAHQPRRGVPAASARARHAGDAARAGAGAPVRSHAPADLSRVPADAGARLDRCSSCTRWSMRRRPGVVWALLGSCWPGCCCCPGCLPRGRAPRRARLQAPVAVVDPANCNGCRRCFDDCPYAAVTMVPHPNQRIGRQLAQVDADLCASCGICVGACPSSTPFRSVAELVTGIDMPQPPIDALRERLQRGAGAHGPMAARLVVFGCDHGARVAALAAPRRRRASA